MRGLTVIANTFASLSVNSVKQSDMKCHSEYFALAQYRLREESQSDCFVASLLAKTKGIVCYMPIPCSLLQGSSFLEKFK